MSDATSDSFRRTLDQIADLAHKHPDYRFEYIHSYISQLTALGDPAAWAAEIDAQWQELPPPRQEACQQLFDHALLRARQANYRPVNRLDAFLERQLHGVEDEEAVLKGTVSQVLRQLEERKRAQQPQPTPTQLPPLQPQPVQPGPPHKAPAAGRTNPLNPRQIPKGPEEKV